MIQTITNQLQQRQYQALANGLNLFYFNHNTKAIQIHQCRLHRPDVLVDAYSALGMLFIQPESRPNGLQVLYQTAHLL